MQVHQGHPLLLLLQLLTIVPGQHSPLAGSQGPIYSPASSPTALMLGQPISSQTSIHPSKLYITQLVWPTHGKIPLIRLLEHMCGPLPSCSFTSSHLSSYLETSILRTNVLSFIHICQQVTSISIWRFFFFETRENWHFAVYLLHTFQVCPRRQFCLCFSDTSQQIWWHHMENVGQLVHKNMAPNSFTL